MGPTGQLEMPLSGSSSRQPSAREATLKVHETGTHPRLVPERVHNVGKDRVTLRAGEDMPAQLICFELSTPTGCLMNGGRLRGLCTCHRGVVVVWPPGVARQVKGANAS